MSYRHDKLKDCLIKPGRLPPIQNNSCSLTWDLTGTWRRQGSYIMHRGRVLTCEQREWLIQPWFKSTHREAGCGPTCRCSTDWEPCCMTCRMGGVGASQLGGTAACSACGTSCSPSSHVRSVHISVKMHREVSVHLVNHSLLHQANPGS